MSKTNSLHYQLCCLGAKWMRRLKYPSLPALLLRCEMDAAVEVFQL